MSTRALRDFIEHYVPAGGADENSIAMARKRAALDEVEAIERACEVIEAGAAASKTDRREADELLSRIAWEVIDRKRGVP